MRRFVCARRFDVTFEGKRKPDENTRKENQDNRNGFRIASEAISALYTSYFAMFSTNRIRIVATCARVALPCGLSVVSVTPVIRPSAFAHCIAVVA